MSKINLAAAVLIIIALVSGCGMQPTAMPKESVAATTVIQTAAANSSADAVRQETAESAEPEFTATPTAEETSTAVAMGSEKKMIEIWVPPQMDPSTNEGLASILRAKIDEFTQENPNAEILIRVKAESGISSTVNTLAAAKNTAPEVIPSLAVISRNDMIAAAQRGLIYPISTGIFTENTTWFDYARKASLVDNLIYGVPIAGDPIVLGYRPSMTGPEVNSWEEILSRGLPIGFNPARPDDPFGAFIYLTYEGNMIDDQGRPWLDQTILTRTLRLFLTGGQQGAFPPSLAMESDPSRNMKLFLEGSMHMIITQLSTFRFNQRNDTAAIPLPHGTESTAYPMVNCWNIVLTNSNPNVQNLAVKFAEKLADPAFNDRWTQILGFLPARTNSLMVWEKDPFYENMMSIAEKADLIPPSSVLNAVLPSINNSITSVIRTSSNPETAAKNAVEALDR